MLEKTLLSINPQVIINLIAETDVNKCESNFRKAKYVNAGIVKNIVRAIKKIDDKQKISFLFTYQPIVFMEVEVHTQKIK